MGDIIGIALIIAVLSLATWLTIWCCMNLLNSRDEISAWRVVRAVVVAAGYVVLIAPIFPSHYH
jgi:hypothetical protein